MHQLRYQSDGRNWRRVIVEQPILDRYPSAVPIDRRNEQEKLVPSALVHEIVWILSETFYAYITHVTRNILKID